jgi:uncharacterized membrane protein
VEHLLGSEFLLLFWPHIAGLAVDRTTESGVVLLQVIGLLLVLASAVVVSSRWPLRRSWYVAAALVLVTLGVATLVLLALGWPLVV